MKTTEKTFDAVDFMRTQREKLSKQLVGMTRQEILDYFRQRQAQADIRPQG